MLKTGIKGPAPPGSMGLILGSTWQSYQGVKVHIGILNPESYGEILLSISVPTKWTFEKGEPLARLILALQDPPDQSKCPRAGDLNSTNPSSNFIIGYAATQNQAHQPLANHLIGYTAVISQAKQPIIPIEIYKRKFNGMLDTGADISIISAKHWPRNWPVKEVSHSLSGVGTISSSLLRQSARWLPCIGPEGNIAMVQPYIVPMPLNLWGRDMLEQWGTMIHIPRPIPYRAPAPALCDAPYSEDAPF